MVDRPPELKPVQSSNVAAIGYDAAKQEFYCEWHNGKISVYQSVPQLTASDIENAPSIGKAVHSHLRGKFAHHYLEE